MQNSGEENFGEFGKKNVILQYFTQPNSVFTKVANVSYCKFANIFLTKNLKRSIHHKVLLHQNFVLYGISHELV